MSMPIALFCHVYWSTWGIGICPVCHKELIVEQYEQFTVQKSASCGPVLWWGITEEFMRMFGENKEPFK